MLRVMGGLETLLLNVLFIVVFLLFVPLFIERNLKAISKKKKKSLLVLSFSLSIISCMLFPIDLEEGFIFDLRWVGVVVGGLYGGIPVSIILTLVTIVFRAILGGGGVYSTIIVGFVLFLVIIFFAEKFSSFSRKRKLLVGFSLSLLNSFLVLFVLYNFFDQSIDNWFSFFYIVLKVCTVTSVIYILDIIEEARLISKRMVKIEKMEVVSQLASSISHEVRNPLAVVRGFLQMMEQSDISTDKRKEFIAISIQEIDRANDIIRDYLTFAKPAMENIEVMDIKKELKRAIEMITPLANLNCIEIHTKIDTYFVKGEPKQFQQCLLNITKNCIEAMHETGKLLIETEENNEKLLIKISDNGIGMTEEQLSRLGEPYFTTKGEEGTGLGMMASIQIINTMNGNLKVTSKVNKGTTFMISFPLISERLK